MKRIAIVMIACITFISMSFITPWQNGGIKESIERGKEVYESSCMGCHQEDGNGIRNMSPTLLKTKWVTGNKGVLVRIVLKGLRGGETEVNGLKFENPMPPLESVLSDQQVADVLTYVRNSWGNKGSAVSAGEVRKGRG
ncbi:MAG: cytochrome c [Chitinophagaceae bacterium]|nr:cytochrome c [Chitinophagaceae bacterium]